MNVRRLRCCEGGTVNGAKLHLLSIIPLSVFCSCAMILQVLAPPVASHSHTFGPIRVSCPDAGRAGSFASLDPAAARRWAARRFSRIC
eukprot:2688596-Rhodomonas_salina.4